MKEAVRKLWELCFGDDPAFVDLYFSRRYSDEVNVAAGENENVIAALQMIPYEMTYYGKFLPVSYISGACTHPDYRSKGVMKELLAESHRRMYENGVIFSILIPAGAGLFDYYSKAGYFPAFSDRIVRTKVGSPAGNDPVKFEKYESDPSGVYSFFERKMAERNCCIQHSETDFSIILDDLHLSKGDLYVVRREKRIEGLAFCIPFEKTLYVTECLTGPALTPETMLSGIARETGCMEIVCKIRPERNGTPKGMARIIHAEAALRHYAGAHPDKSLIIRLSDDQLSQNNGLYVLKNGMCYKASGDVLPESATELNAGQLSELFFRNERAFMSLMLD